MSPDPSSFIYVIVVLNYIVVQPTKIFTDEGLAVLIADLCIWE